MSEEQEIISDEEIELVHANANFGDTPKRDVVKYALLKAACGYHSGSFATAIIKEHRIVNRDLEVTAKGRLYLWAAFGK